MECSFLVVFLATKWKEQHKGEFTEQQVQVPNIRANDVAPAAVGHKTHKSILILPIWGWPPAQETTQVLAQWPKETRTPALVWGCFSDARLHLLQRKPKTERSPHRTRNLDRTLSRGSSVAAPCRKRQHRRGTNCQQYLGKHRVKMSVFHANPARYYLDWKGNPKTFIYLLARRPDPSGWLLLQKPFYILELLGARFQGD